MLLICSIALHAQNDVTRFLGIPVDGSKYEMIQKLKAKGFQSTPSDKDVLTGEFNGTNVNIYVVTTNNRVSRIMVCDANSIDEASIKIRFNKLCRQFENNKKYISASLSSSDYTLSEDEDISYEMTVHKKRYEAAYYQKPMVADSVIIRSFLLSKYSNEQLANITEELQEEMMKECFEHMLDRYSKKLVWFMISQDYGRYSITMFYDNEYNRANGDDL